MANDINIHDSNIEQLEYKICTYIDNARKSIQRSIDSEMLRAYFMIGHDIVEAEQKGRAKANYASYLIKRLSVNLNKKYNKGFSVTSLKNARYFYLIYKDTIGQTLPAQFSENLGWSHYELLMRISRVEARKFYEIEADRNHWSVRELKRQIASLLFDRLAKSKDKEGLMKLSCEGQEIRKPSDAIKDPVILEFLNLPISHRLVESKLEEIIIDNLQHFLLELGKGVAFVARQKRLTLDGDHFYADLVFYSIPLKAYLIIDIKTHELSHADLGQMQLYVNYFDQKIRTDTDNPTIGLILCTEKNNEMVRYTLGEKAQQIFASKYQFHLPTEEELEQELRREIRHIEEDLN